MRAVPAGYWRPGGGRQGTRVLGRTCSDRSSVRGSTGRPRPPLPDHEPGAGARRDPDRDRRPHLPAACWATM